MKQKMFSFGVTASNKADMNNSLSRKFWNPLRGTARSVNRTLYYIIFSTVMSRKWKPAKICSHTHRHKQCEQQLTGEGGFANSTRASVNFGWRLPDADPEALESAAVAGRRINHLGGQGWWETWPKEEMMGKEEEEGPSKKIQGNSIYSCFESIIPVEKKMKMSSTTSSPHKKSVEWKMKKISTAWYTDEPVLLKKKKK